MGRPAAWPSALLAGLGVVMVAIGIAGLAIGLWLGDWIYAQFPPDNNTDAAAVGGAAFALGVTALLLAYLHVGMAMLLWRSRALVAGTVLCAGMGVLALAWAVAALVSAASGAAPAIVMLPSGIGLALVAAAYGWAATALIGLRRRSRRPD